MDVYIFVHIFTIAQQPLCMCACVYVGIHTRVYCMFEVSQIERMMLLIFFISTQLVHVSSVTLIHFAYIVHSKQVFMMVMCITFPVKL